MDKNEINNSNMDELNKQLSDKVALVMDKIGLIEKAIIVTIEDAIEDCETPTTITEINAALLNVLRKMNRDEIMHMLK